MRVYKIDLKKCFNLMFPLVNLIGSKYNLKEEIEFKPFKGS